MLKGLAQVFGVLLLTFVSLHTAVADGVPPLFKEIDCVNDDVTTSYSVSNLFPSLSVGKAPSATDHTTIGDAIANASSGYKIYICPGIYEENLFVDKNLKFVGLDPDQSLTVVDGTSSGIIFEGDSFINMSFEKLTLQNGYSSADGGAINTSGDLKVKNVSFKWNEAESDGGAIYSWGANSFKIESSAFLLNTAGDTGGAISVAASTLADIGNTTFSNNHSENDGGAIHSSSDIRLGSDDFIHNTTQDDGGALDVFCGCEATIQNSTFHANSAGIDGGALSLTTDISTISGTTFDENSAGDDGGAIDAGSSFLDLEETEFEANNAVGNGGAILSRGTIDTRKSLFSLNEAENGGALYFEDGGIENSTFYWNEATNEGGAIYLNYTTVISRATIDSSTLTRNLAASDGGALFIDTSSSLSIKNSILASNYVGSTAQSCNAVPTSEDYNLESENTCGLTESNDLVSTSPGFDGYGLLGVHGGFTMTVPLSSSSAARDSGSCALIDTTSNTTDQRGYGRPSGSTCDRGAYEY